MHKWFGARPRGAAPSHGRSPWAERMLLGAAGLALCGMGACTPTHVVRVDMTHARPEVLDTLRGVGAGDLVRVVVLDSVWGNRYTAATHSSNITPVERNLVFGATGLAKLTSWFAPLVQTSGGSADPGRPFALDDACAAPGPLRAAAQADVDRMVFRSDQLAALRDSITTTVDLLTSNEFAALRAFVTDPDAHRLVHAVANDPLAPETADRLAALAEFRDTRGPDPEALDALVIQAHAYGRRVASVAALAPEGAQDPDMGVGLSRFKEQVLRYRELVPAVRADEARLATLPCTSGQLGDTEISLRRGAVDLSPLVDNPALDPGALDLALRRIIRNTQLLAGTLNALPAWSVGPVEQVALERSFEGNREITVSLLSRPRYGRFDARVQETPLGAKKEDDGKDAPAAPRLIQLQDDTLAAFRFEVYPRYRFQLGAGFVYSPLRTRGYETRDDTVGGVPGLRVRQTGETPFQVFPAALLSYTIFPTAGQIYDARVRPGWPSLSRLGLALQAGVSLTDPTDDLMIGVSTEPFPGLRLGGGYHLSYVQVARAAPGTFVPAADGPALERRWRGEWGAATLAVDATVFFSTLGALFK